MIPKLRLAEAWNRNIRSPVTRKGYFEKILRLRLRFLISPLHLLFKWTVGKTVEVVKSKDDLVRRATVQYQNATESKSRFTDHAARSLIKLLNVEDQD